MQRPTVEAYDEVVKRYHESSNGPDGTPLRALKRTRARSALTSFEASVALTDAPAPDPPFWFNLCRLVFIIKKRSFEVPEIGVVIDPENLRPISVANFENQILNAGFKPALEISTKSFCDPAQQGFIGDLAKNVFEFDGEIHLQHRKGTGGGGLLCDVIRAYPSLAHCYIFWFLSFIGIEEWFLVALRRMCSHIRHCYRHGSVQEIGFWLLCGSRQGDPLSTYIFVVCLDPLICVLKCCYLLRGDRLFGFADDMALNLHRISRLVKVLLVFMLLVLMVLPFQSSVTQIEDSLAYFRLCVQWRLTKVARMGCP